MDLALLKESFNTVSHELIARRTLDLSAPAIVTVFDQGALTWRRANVTQSPPALTDDERQAWREAHELADVAECDSPAGRIRCWPIHEEAWRREILRYDLAVEL